MRSRFLVIHNPEAGRMRRRLLQGVVRALESADCTITTHVAGRPEAGLETARHAAECGLYDAVAAAGGDGTIRAVAAGLKGSSVPLGIIPMGTGNVMAHEIGLRREASVVARTLREGACLPMRGARVNGVPFFLMAGAGFDGRAVAALRPRLKRRLGKLAYLWPICRALAAPLPELDIEIDGHHRRGAWAVITNARHYAGGFTLCPGSCLLSPGLHAVISQAPSRLGMLGDLLSIGLGRAERAPFLHMVPCARAVIRASRAVPAQIDGECLGTTPLEIIPDDEPLLILLPCFRADGDVPLAQAAE